MAERLMSPERSRHYVLVIVALLLVSWWPSTAARAATTGSSADAETHPRVMQETGDQVAKAPVGQLQPFTRSPSSASTRYNSVNGSLTKDVFGFGLLSSIADPTLGYPSWNFSLLTTVAVFGLHVNWDGSLIHDSGWTVWNSSQMTGLLNAAHASGTKVVLTIILQDFCTNDATAGCGPGNPTPNMCDGLYPQHRATTVSQTVAEVAAKGVDGVNVDYEGLEVSCADGVDPRTALTSLMKELRAGLASGSNLSIDTYASSAPDTAGFFDVPGMAPYTDSFFVMAYDSDFSNYNHAPLNCSGYCLNPVSPLSGYYYNDTRAANEYAAAVPPSKVILGLPYYSRADCVSSWAANQYPQYSLSDRTHNFNLSYRSAVTMATDPTNSNYALNRDAYDTAGHSPWSTWTSSSAPACKMEMYWDDLTSLGAKYGFIARSSLRGVGIWNLNQGGGDAGLWGTLNAYFGARSLGGSLSADPAAASWGPDRLDLFVRGADQSLWHRPYNAGWDSWESLGGSLDSNPPAAVSGAANRVDVFVEGADQTLWHRRWNGSSWDAWEGVGGRLSSGPGAASSSATTLDVFVRGADNALWHRHWNGTGWDGWEGLGGVLASGPGTVSWAAGRIDVFVRGADNQLWHRAFVTPATGPGGWQPWEALGGVLSSAPAASSCSAGSLDVFAVGADKSLWRRTYSSGGSSPGWGPWTGLGGVWNGGPAAVCQPTTTKIDLFERGTDNAAYTEELPS